MSKLLTDPAYALEALCHRYLNHRNRHSYDFFKNGESDLLAKVATIRPEIVFDVGANVGDWSSIAHDLFPQATVHCFELSERTFSTLTRNISGAHFVLNNAGLSDKLGILCNSQAPPRVSPIGNNGFLFSRPRLKLIACGAGT